MSSYADTIRTVRFRADLVRRAGFDFYQAPQRAQDALGGLAGEMDKWAEALDVLLAENQRLRGAIEEYILWRPGERGHAAAHRKLCEALAGDTR